MQAVRGGSTRGLTLLEVLVILVVVVLLFPLLMPYRPRAKAKPQRIACVNQLKTIGMGLQHFADLHGGELPMNVPNAQGGTRELAADVSQLWRQFLVLSNELTRPKILVCPSDVRRRPAQRFPVPGTNVGREVVFRSNQNLSYFLSLDASLRVPGSLLAGDRNLTNETGPLSPGRHRIATGALLGFTGELHGNAGNILLGDGSVQQLTSGRLREQFQEALTHSGLAANRWLVP